jgi:hypothetical protein
VCMSVYVGVCFCDNVAGVYVSVCVIVCFCVYVCVFVCVIVCFLRIICNTQIRFVLVLIFIFVKRVFLRGCSVNSVINISHHY